MSIIVINNKTKREIAQSKMEGYMKYCEIMRWGRQNPSKFASMFLGIEFM